MKYQILDRIVQWHFFPHQLVSKHKHILLMVRKPSSEIFS